MGGCSIWYRVSVSIFFIFFGLLLAPEKAQAQPEAIEGILDLRTIDFDLDEPIPLKGKWEFYWKQLIEPSEPFDDQKVEFVQFPNIWNKDEDLGSFGFATYRLKILLPDSSPPLAFSLPDFYTSYNFYVNGALLASNGIVADNAENYEPKWLPITSSLYNYQKDSLEIVLQIANFRHHKGGARLPIVIGANKKLVHTRELHLGYAFILTGALIMGGLFFLGLYLFGRNEKPILYFSLFCLCYSYRVFGTELYPLHLLLSDIPWIYTVRAEYISLYLSPVLFGLFLKHLYPSESSKIVIAVFHTFFLVFAVIALIFPAYYFTQLINPFFLMGAIYIGYSSLVFAKAVTNKRQGSKYAIASGIVLFVVFIMNLLEYYVIIEESLLLNVIGYLSFFFLQSLILSERFGRSLTDAKERAEHASLAKTQFLSTMGHELRTPLNAVIGFSELIVDSKSQEERVEFASIIKKSGESLLGIINNILDYSKIETKNITIENERVDLPAFLEDTIKMLSALTINKKVVLNLHFNLDVQTIETDPTRLRQILINLIGNAIKFTENGTISIHVENSSTDQKGNILFTVKDTGIGIPSDKINLLFKEFSQVDANINRKYGGTGLGLAISKKLVENLGGKIWVKSIAAEGTEFHFTIKAKKISPKKSDSTKFTSNSVSQNLSGLKILIVEDNVINQKVAQKLLERLGYKADIAENGLVAINMVPKTSYDLIFMDMEMPGLDGIETTLKILNLELPKKPIIIAMTALATPEDHARCLKAGMSDFVPKPITLQSVNKAIIKQFDL